MKTEKETVLLTPGTLRVSPRVLGASVSGQYNHRAPEIVEAFDEIKSNLRDVLGLPDQYGLVFFPTSGRGGVEALVSAVAATHDLLAVVNGRWSAYGAEIAKRYNSRSLKILQMPEDAPIDTQLLEAEIKKEKPQVVFFVSHETERGLLNPTGEIVRVCKGAGCSVIIDAISSVVVEETDFAELGADAFCLSASKGLRSLRDISIVAIKESFAGNLTGCGRFLNFAEEYVRQIDALPSNPFSTSAVLSLREATRELLEEGVANRRESIKAKMQILHTWARARNLRPTIDLKHLGWYTLPLYLPRGWTYRMFREQLLGQGYDVFYSHEGGDGRTFEVSTLGFLSEADVQGFIEAADRILHRIVFVADNNAIHQRQKLIEALPKFVEVVDVSDQRGDYVSLTHEACKILQGGGLGVFMCGTGQGTALVANKHRGVRATRCLAVQDAVHAKTINSANVLCLSAETGIGANASIIEMFFKTPYEGRKPERLHAIRKLEDRLFSFGAATCAK